MVVASNFLVQNASNMSLTKKNNNNNNNNNNNSSIINNNESEAEAKVIKVPAEAKEKDGESLDSESKAKTKAPCCMLMCRDNSHPFQDRVLMLDRPVKIGRTVARAKAAATNAIFDCKVLSRHHALLWFKNGKFYLQDTKSSNGTFVNNQRLSATNEQSAPREVCSGDVVQFGVNVVENTKNVQHGCIIATLRLYLPDGTEAKASNVVSCPTNVSLEDLYKLNQYLQEAGKREKTLRFKLSMVERLVDSTRTAAAESWKAYIDEDKLLSRIETVEGQLVAYSKNFNNDKIREELARLQEEKAQYQNAAKEALRIILNEKYNLSLQLEICKSRLDEAEQEKEDLRQVAKKNQQELQEFAAKYSEAQGKVGEMLNKLAENEELTREVIERTELERDYLMRRLTDKISNEKKLLERLRAARLDLAFLLKQVTALQAYVNNGEEGAEIEENKYSTSMASELVVATLNKLNSMVEAMDAISIEEDEDKDGSTAIINSEDEKSKLDMIRGCIEKALDKLKENKVELMQIKSAKIEELGEEKPNGMAEKSEEEAARLEDVADKWNKYFEKLIQVVDAEKKEDEEKPEEKLDYNTDGAESDATEIEFTQVAVATPPKVEQQETVEGAASEAESQVALSQTEPTPSVAHAPSGRSAEEELEALREKCRALEEQEALLAEKYASLQSQCGDLLNSTYMVPIHYVAPILLVLLWMLLEKIF